MQGAAAAAGKPKAGEAQRSKTPKIDPEYFI
jgi:hypothetical protein